MTSRSVRLLYDPSTLANRVPFMGRLQRNGDSEVGVRKPGAIAASSRETIVSRSTTDIAPVRRRSLLHTVPGPRRRENDRCGGA